MIEPVPQPVYLPTQMIGRARNGAERDRGVRYHAVSKTAWAALCGAAPGRHSAGWSEHLGDVVTCPRCLSKLAKLSAKEPTDGK